ncbi:MAG: hypothetical protein IKA87_05165 [Lentisphaeria bacterium]|nr:hypothetical protein [Lentisphaeria bacterium]
MNKFRTITMYFALVLLTIALLFGASAVARKLDAGVKANNLRFTGEIKNAPVMVTFTTVALGSFRGIVADLLWLRAGALQEKQNYFEMVQLARWITDLQPTFSGATAYLAWNMAYNISVTCSNYEERWRWVNEGVRLIRDQAIEYNPEDPVLYKDLAWIFQHKLGNVLDDANLLYKNRLAIQMMDITGSAEPSWKELAAAPASQSEFMKKYSEDGKIWQIVKDAGFKDFDALYNDFRSRKPAALSPVLNGKLGSSILKDFTVFLRAELLRRQLKLDPDVIVEINEKYGTLDWRVPESQAIYWATMGLKRTPGHKDLSLSRLITQSLYESFRSGRLLMVNDKDFSNIVVAPNIALVDAVYRTYDEVHQAYDAGNNYSTFRSAKINFIKEAIGILYNFGKFSKAKEYYELLMKEEDHRKREDLEAFVTAQWAEDVRDAGVKKASEVISGLIFKSIFYLIYNDNDAALANERLARYIYAKYSADIGSMERMKLPSYKQMKRVVVEQCLKTFPPQMVLILKAKIAAEQTENQIDSMLKKVPGSNVSGERKL